MEILKVSYVIDVMNLMEKKNKKFEEVLKFLIPYYKIAALNILKKEKIDFENKIEEGIEKGLIHFNEKLKIDLKKLKNKHGEEWVNILKKQLKVFSKTFSKKD